MRGFEHLPDDDRYLAASACCKHYVANSMEDSRTVNIHHTRYSADPNITMQDLVDSYMAPFQACVEKVRPNVVINCVVADSSFLPAWLCAQSSL